MSNALIEGINAKIRLINARCYGHHSAQTLTSMIYLCWGGLQVTLPEPHIRTNILRAADRARPSHPERTICDSRAPSGTPRSAPQFDGPEPHPGTGAAANQV
uniref:transposase n=1 Tax=Mycolicibacterium fallax TaxID=1793 RepID=UPI003899514F